MKKILAYNTVLAATISMIGCGGGSNNNNEAPTQTVQAQAGQPLIVSTLVDGVLVAEDTYKVYRVVDVEGTLSDKSLAKEEEIRFPHVALLQSRAGASQYNLAGTYFDWQKSVPGTAFPNVTLMAPIGLADVQTCYKDLFATVKQLNPALKTRDQVAARLEAMDVSVDDLCTQVPTSGLSMVEYLALFDKVSSYWPNVSDIDGKMAMFFIKIKVRPVTFQTALADAGYNWDQFLQRLSSRDNGLNEFYGMYERWDKPTNVQTDTANFLKHYMQKTETKVLSQVQRTLAQVASWLGDQLVPSARADWTKVPGTIESYFDIIKTVWNVIEGSIGTTDVKGKQSHVLSSEDNNPLHYYGAKTSRTPVVEFVGKTYFFELWENYRVEMRAVCDYDARNPNVPGQWMPNIGIVTPVVDASWGLGKGYNITGDVQINNAVDRRASPEAAPIPSVDMTMNVAAKAFTTVRRSYSFTCRGDTGAVFNN